MTKKQTKLAPTDEQPTPEIALLQEQIDLLTQALQRERADAENLRRRHSEELAGLRVSVKALVVKDLLPIIDNFERALKHVPADLVEHDYIKGVESIVKQFEKTLADMGVSRMPGVGEPFDPHYHEAVSAEDGGDGTERISEELQAGYRIGDQVIRPSMVRVRS